MRWLDSVIDSMDMSLRKFREIVKDREAWRAAIYGVAKNQTRLSCGFFRMMHRCVSAPSCCTFILKAAFQEVSEHRILIKSGPGNWSLSASGTTHKATYRISP